MKITRCATRRANPISWVTTIIVIPLLARSVMTSSTSLIISGSSADVGARSRDDQRGAGGHDRSGQERYDNDGRHPRDGVRPARGASRDLHGRRPGDRGGGSRDLLRLTQVRPVAAILIQDPLSLRR